MFVCIKRSNIEGIAARSASELLSVDAKYSSGKLFHKMYNYRNYKRISLMNNYVPLNNNTLQDIVLCFNSQYWSRFMHMV